MNIQEIYRFLCQKGLRSRMNIPDPDPTWPKSSESGSSHNTKFQTTVYFHSPYTIRYISIGICELGELRRYGTEYLSPGDSLHRGLYIPVGDEERGVASGLSQLQGETCCP
jgi:hypothetical protein